MGIFDFVKNGVKEMAIARPEASQELIFKHPDRTIPMYAQCTVRADEWAVFAKDGRPLGTLDAGRHTLQAQNIPFLSNLVDSFTGGNVFLSEVFFVKRTPFPMRFGGSLGNMIDPMTQIRLRARSHGELLLRVENPERVIFGYFGMQKYQDNPDVFSWLTDLFFSTVKTTIGRLAKEQKRTILDIMDMQTELQNAFVANCQDLNEIGVRVVKVTKFEIDVPEEDLKRFDEQRQKVADQMVGLQVDELAIQRAALQAQADVARARVGVEKAQFDAQAKQVSMDQQYQQDSRYVQNLAGSYQGYAAGQAMMGAGQGMAKGEGGAGLAGAGAQLGVGMGVAAMYAQGVQAAAPQFNPANAPRAGGPGGGGAMVQCPGCQRHVAPGKFCAECGTSLAPQSKRCAGCGVEQAPGAKFCPECGTKA